LVYTNNVIRGKLMEKADLMSQAANNSKEHFASSPDLARHIESAIIDSMDAFAAMSK
jgi:type I restriction enzyme R subunit